MRKTLLIRANQYGAKHEMMIIELISAIYCFRMKNRLFSDLRWFICARIGMELVSSEQITSVDFIFYVVQRAVITVGNNGIAHLFELLQVVDNFASEEGRTIF